MPLFICRNMYMYIKAAAEITNSLVVRQSVISFISCYIAAVFPLLLSARCGLPIIDFVSPEPPFPHLSPMGREEEGETPRGSACPHSDANPLPSAFFLWGRLSAMPRQLRSLHVREENP